MSTKYLYKTKDGEKEVMDIYDDLLANWTVPHEPTTVFTRHGRTFVIASGEQSSPVLILLHGTNSNSAYWLRDIAEYRQFYRVYALDIPGEPGKSSYERPPWDGPSYCEWLEDVINTLGVKKASILGLSQGAWIAIKFTLCQPEKVNRLVLLSPAGIARLRPTLPFRILPRIFPGKKDYDKVLKVVFGKQNIPPETLRFSRVMLDNFISRKTAMPVFTDEELRRLAMPVLLIVSRQDALFDWQKTVERLKTLLPDLKTVVLSEAGHSIYDHTELILPFLYKSETEAVTLDSVLTPSGY
jgi:pimeloyl-ACP methyl ester carboxylesterase